jgi:heterodisulfide reductase subunit C
MAVRQLVVAVVEVFGSLLTAKAKVQSQDCTTCGICAGQSGTGTFFVFSNSLIVFFKVMFYACLS